MKKIFYLFIIMFSFSSAQQAGKVYILSEGGFSAGSSKLSMLDNYTGTFTQNIFSPGNIGLYPDGLIYYDGYLYMLEQGSFGGSGKIFKLDTNGTVINSKVTGVNPYSLAISNNKVFITNGPASSVTILNASDFTDIGTIQVGVYPQEILSGGGKVYVANTSLYGGAEDRTVSVVDAVTNTQLTKIVVQKDPSSLAMTPDGYLLVACPGDAANGVIYKIDTATFAKTDSFFVPAEGVGKDLVVDKNDTSLYFISSNGNLVHYNMSTRQVNVVVNSVLGTNYFYGYGYDYLAKKHYVLDAKNFTVTGSLYVYNQSGTLLNIYSTGIAPRRVIFKYDGGFTSVKEKTSNKNNILANYPNPAKAKSKLKFIVENGSEDRESTLSINVYNMLGEKIETLLETSCVPGEYEVEYDVSLLSAGVYYYALKRGGEYAISKFIVIK